MMGSRDDEDRAYSDLVDQLTHRDLVDKRRSGQVADRAPSDAPDLRDPRAPEEALARCGADERADQAHPPERDRESGTAASREQPPSGPYAPPRAIPDPPRPSVGPVSLVVAAYAVVLLLSLLAVVSNDLGPLLGGASGREVASKLTSVRMILAVVWVRSAWKCVPEGQRGGLTPWGVIKPFLVPLYDFYWMFVFNIALCDILNANLEHRSSLRAPRAFAVLAGTFELGALVSGYAVRNPDLSILRSVVSFLPGAMWLVYMLFCEPACRAVAVLGPAPGVQPVRLRAVPGCLTVVVSWLLFVAAAGAWVHFHPRADHRHADHADVSK
jgi:hypothetical protein